MPTDPIKTLEEIKINDMKLLLTKPKQFVNFVFKHGMTPGQYTRKYYKAHKKAITKEEWLIAIKTNQLGSRRKPG